MTSIRVHELAKELSVSSKDVIARLEANGVVVKNHLSTVEQADAERLRAGMGFPQTDHEKKPEPHSSAPQAVKTSEGPRPDDRNENQKEARPVRSEEERSARPRMENRPPRPAGERPPRPEGHAARPGMENRPPRPAGERPPRPEGYPPRPGMENRPPRPAGERPPRPDGYPPRPGMEHRPPRPAGERPPRPAGDRPVRPEGYPPRPGMEHRPPRPAGDRPPRPEGYPPRPGMENRPPRPAGDRPPRPEGYPPRPGMENRPPRPAGDRPPRPEGYPPRPGMENRPPRPAGDRPPRPEGYPPRPGMDNRPPRPAGDRPLRPGGYPPRPGMDRPGMPPRPRPQAGASAATPAVEQPVKRQAPDKKKAQDRSYEKRREPEKDFRGPHRRGAKLPVKEVRDATPKHIVIPETISVQELAAKMSRKAGELIVKLMGLGVMATINQELDAETATILSGEMGVTTEVKVEKSLTVVEEIQDSEESLKPRPPVVTVMGHVDHGKTSLLDAIRTTNVTASEAGGITQHIGAYQVEIKGQKITFLDTPGHEAFTAMRARGAQVTDIAILVVAADDGIMPQTIEAINHAKAADVPIIIAINKIDKENANTEKVKQELTEYGLVVEEWGGDTIAVPVSAKTKFNIEHLLEMILLVAEVRELKANPNRAATGTVIEAELDKGKGPVATVLVAKGTLNVGDVVVAGSAFGKIRAMVDDKGRRVKKAGPSTPVELQGLAEVPLAGEPFDVVNDEKLARHIAGARTSERKAEEAKQTVKVSLDDLFDRIKEGEVKELNIIIKGDVQGSVEALRQSLERLSTGEVRVNPIHGGVGAITETDVMLAAASNAIIIGFNVRPDSNTKATAELQGVDLRLYRVIYDAIEDVKAAMTGLLDPDFKEVVQGKAEVRQVFKVPKVGSVAGCFVTEGKVSRSAKVRVVRDGIVIHEGNLDSLRRFKDDVREVNEGYECGIGIERFNDIKEGDIIEAFILEEVKRQL